ncbi:MAG TPA: carboxy-S-adenosyl-L-methionine synthase CmoA [Planctomycetota bacterium]|nr:carboxy-S-adenosyl-L-methionine synthase CmoA [Planctomycetota bacterium]
MKDRIFHEEGRVSDFEFDARVAGVFDDMVARSVPYYDEVQRLQVDLAVEFLPERESLVYDLGCSTGTTLHLLASHPRCPAAARFVGLDNSPAMLDKAREKLRAAGDRATLLEADLNAGVELRPCRIVFLNWTLQFVRPLYRETLVRRIFEALEPGGALFLSEKVLLSNSFLNRLYIEHYLQYKRSRGYSDAEIQRKREALENVLVPYRLEENRLMLERAGFGTIDPFFRWLNFACILAVKAP